MSISLGSAVLYLSRNDDKLKSGLASSRSSIMGWASGIENVLGVTLGTVFGNTVSAGINMITSAIQDTAAEALRATSAYQTLSIQFEGLVAREIASQYNKAHVVDVVTQQVISLTDKERGKLVELREDYRLTEIQIAAQGYALADIEKKHGKNNTVYETAAIKLEQLRRKLNEYGQEIGALSAKDNQLINVISQVSKGSMTAGDALKIAGKPAQDLLNWIKEIAVTTPFTVEGLSRTLAMSMAMGITSDNSKKLTMAIGNFTAGMGLTEEHLQRIVYNFGQMNAMGKVSGREIRDLSNSMVPVNDILDAMAKKHNITTDAMRKLASEGGVEVQEFFDAFIEMSNRDFPGAMDRMSMTWQGVTSNIKDFIGGVLGVELLTPVVDKVTKALARGLQFLVDPEVREKFKEWGEALGGALDRVLPNGDQVVKFMQGFIGLLGQADARVWLFFYRMRQGDSALTAFARIVRSLLPPEAQAQFDKLLDFGERIAPYWNIASEAFSKLGQAILRDIQPHLPSFVQLIERLAGEQGLQFFKDLRTIAVNLGQAWDQHGKGITQLVMNLLALGAVTLASLVGGVGTLGAALSAFAAGKPGEGITIVREGVERLASNIFGFMGTDLPSFREQWEYNFNAMYIIGKWWFDNVIMWIPNLVSWYYTQLGLFWSNFFSSWGTGFTGLWAIWQGWASNITSGFQKWAIESILFWVKLWNDINAESKKFDSEFEKLGGAMMDHIMKGITQKIAQVLSTVRKMVTDALNEAGKVLGDVNPFGGSNPAPSATGGLQPFRQEKGGDWLVTKPTLFLAGEKEVERATFTPLGAGAFAGAAGMGNVTINVTISNDLDAELWTRKLAERFGSA